MMKSLGRWLNDARTRKSSRWLTVQTSPTALPCNWTSACPNSDGSGRQQVKVAGCPLQVKLLKTFSQSIGTRFMFSGEQEAAVSIEQGLMAEHILAMETEGMRIRLTYPQENALKFILDGIDKDSLTLKIILGAERFAFDNAFTTISIQRPTLSRVALLDRSEFLLWATSIVRISSPPYLSFPGNNVLQEGGSLFRRWNLSFPTFAPIPLASISVIMRRWCVHIMISFITPGLASCVRTAYPIDGPKDCRSTDTCNHWSASQVRGLPSHQCHDCRLHPLVCHFFPIKNAFSLGLISAFWLCPKLYWAASSANLRPFFFFFTGRTNRGRWMLLQ